MEIFDVFSMNGIENYPAAGEIFLENVIFKVSQTHFPRISTPRGGINFSRGGGAVKYPVREGGFNRIKQVNMRIKHVAGKYQISVLYL